MKAFVQWLVLGVVGACVLAMAGCNTVKGVGRDIESVGEAGEKAISD
jgi:predicted small secreted protein